MFSFFRGFSGPSRGMLAYMAGCDGETFPCKSGWELAQWFEGFAYYVRKVGVGL
jgi:hypothetical protein